MARFLLLVILAGLLSGADLPQTRYDSAQNARAKVVGIITANRERSTAVQAGITGLVSKYSLSTIDVATFGFLAACDGDNMAAITATSKNLTSATALWKSTDVGRTIHVAGAGVAGATLTTTIAAYVSPGAVTLTGAASTTVTPSVTSAAGIAVWGDPVNLTITADPLKSGTDSLYAQTLNLTQLSAATVTAPGSTTARTLAARAGDTVNVKDYGAAGDGIADDTAEIQAAVTAVTGAGGCVYIPRGTYKLSAAITVPEYVKIRGDSTRGTIINQTRSANAFQLGGAGSSLYYGCGLENLSIQLAQPDGGGVDLSATCGAVLRDLYIEGYYGLFTTRSNVGVRITGGNASSFFNKIDTVTCNHMHIGFELAQSAVMGTQNVFTNCSSLGDVSILQLGAITPGTLYTAGTYNSVALSGGTGTGAMANITVAGGAVTNVTVTSAGSGYTIGNSLTCANGLIGGTGAGWSVLVAMTGDTTSRGLLVRNTAGQGTVWIGGNFESIARGIQTEANAWEFNVYGARFEGNTYDIYHSSAYSLAVYGAVSLVTSKIYWDSAAWPAPLRLYGCYDSSHNPISYEYGFASAAPASDYHYKGEMRFNSSPTAGGVMGWVCTVAGTPGTWKAMATIAP